MSTYDIYRYTFKALDKREDVDVIGFPTHARLTYHGVARDEIRNWDTDYDVDILGACVVDIMGIIAVNRPHVVHVIDGSLFGGPLFAALRDLSESMVDSFVVSLHMTEEPYSATGFADMRQYAHVLFVNEKKAVREFDPEGKHMVYWMPHSYDIDTHRPNLDYGSKDLDLVFIGTVYPERLPYVKADWGDLRCMFGGNDLTGEADLVTQNIYNEELADLYRSSKIAFNKHREMGTILDRNERGPRYMPHSMSPRLVEAAACGALVLTDYRDEVGEVFGDSALVYSTPEEAVELAKEYSADKDKWERMALAAHEAISGRTYDATVERMLGIWNEAIGRL